MTKSEQKTDISINVNKLDEEWVNQSDLYRKWAEHLADARREWDYAKAELELVKAELSRDMRVAADKISEKAIESNLPLEEKYGEAQEAVTKAKHEVDVLVGMVSALDHRRTALSNLVSLYLANYYSKPKAPEGDEDEIDKMEKRMVRSRGRRRRNDD